MTVLVVLLLVDSDVVHWPWQFKFKFRNFSSMSGSEFEGLPGQLELVLVLNCTLTAPLVELSFWYSPP